MFDVYVQEKAFEKAKAHFQAQANVGLEGLGLLLGGVFSFEGRKYVVVEDYVTAENDATAVSVRFSREAFAELSEKLSSEEGGRIIVGWCHCLSPDELVMTSDGIMTAQQVYSRVTSRGPIKVPTIDLNNSRGCEALLTRAFRYKTTSFVDIQTRLNRSITATPRHRFLVLNGSRCGWLPAAMISNEDYIAVPSSIKMSGGIKFDLNRIKLARPSSQKYFPKLPRQPNKDLMRFIGLLYSDGHIRPRAFIEFSNNNIELIKDFCRLAKKLFGLTPKLSTNGKNIRARFFSRVVYLYLSTVLDFSKERLPPFVFKCSRKEINAFIDGLALGDGCTSRVSSGKRETVTAIYLGEKPRPSYDLAYLYSCIGVKARVRIQKQNFAKRKHDYIYAVVVQDKPKAYSDVIPHAGKTIRKLCRKYGVRVHPHFAVKEGGITRKRIFECIKKFKQLELAVPEIKSLERLAKMPVNWIKVKSVTSRRVNSFVYDFHVPNYNIFLAGKGPIISHNSHPGYGCFLSSIDVRTHKVFFPEDFHFAMVFDPKASEGKGEWKVFKLSGAKSKGYAESSFAVIRKK